MVICGGCRSKFCTIRALMRHIQVDCEPSQLSGCYRCGQDGCSRYYTSANSLRKHIKRHSESVAQKSRPDMSLINLHVDVNKTALINNGLMETCTDNEVREEVGTLEFDNINVSNDSQIRNFLSDFIASFYANVAIPRSVVKGITSNVKTLISNCLSLQPSLECENLMLLLSKNLSKFDTEYKCLKHFQALGTYIPPTEIFISQRQETKRTNGIYHMTTASASMQVIPLGNLLRALLSKSSVMSDILKFIRQLETEPFAMSSFMQGTIWKDLAASKQGSKTNLTLPIILYTDDFETGNPLGSHSGIHKLGGVYISLPCLPPKYYSKLDSILLVALFHSKDRETYGNKAIFNPILDQLKALQNEGIKIETNAFFGSVKFVLGAIVGDNLGIHSILGFVESFSANFPCRICKVHKKEMKSLIYEKESLLRNAKNYKEDLSLANCSLTGIKEECIWLSLDNFDLFKNVGVDVMHDILEGCARYIFSFILQDFIIDSNFFSLDTINNRIFAFDYGPDTNSKPLGLSWENGSIQVRMSASEMLTFTRYFGLLTGDMLPRGYPIWELYIALRQVLNILLDKSPRPGTSDILSCAISELNKLYIDNAKCSMKPKFHFLTHYPAMLNRFGPLCHIWSMRFEAKHRVSKIIARASCSRINICKTIAIRNQLHFNAFLLQHVNSSSNEIKWGIFRPVPKCNFESVQCFASNKCSVPKLAKWLKVLDNVYRKGIVVTYDILELTNFPVFYEIKEIFSVECKALLWCHCLTTVDFDEHFQAYVVIRTSQMHYVWLENLCSPIPNNITTLTNGFTYVTLRSPIT